MHNREQIKETQRQLYQEIASLSKVLQLIIHAYFKFVIHSKFYLRKWSLNQCDWACFVCNYSLFYRLVLPCFAGLCHRSILILRGLLNITL